MKCKTHEKGQVVLHAFSFGLCGICGKEVCTPHIPTNKVCDKCSEELSLCEVCAYPIEE